MSRIEVTSLLASFVVFIAAAAPPAYEAITSPNLGNLGKIIFFTGSRTGSQSLGDVLPYIESFFDLMLGETRIQGRFIAPFLILCAISAYRGNPRFFALFLLLIVALSLLTIPSALHIRGGLHPFICWHLYGVAAALYGAAAIGCASWLERQRWSGPLLNTSVAPLCCALLSILVAVRHTPNNSCVSSGVYESAVTHLALRVDTLYVLETREGHVPWQHYAQIAYALSRHNIAFCVAQRWEFMYGLDRSCRRLIRERGPEASVRTLQLVAKSSASPEPTVGALDAGPFLIVERPYDKERLSD